MSKEKAIETFYDMRDYLLMEWSDVDDIDNVEICIKALEIIKECFNFNGFDELIPNNKWFESEEKQNLLRKVLTSNIL